MFQREEWEEDVYGQERNNFKRPTNIKSDIYQDIEGFLDRTARSVYNSVPIRRISEMPELHIIAGIFLCKIVLWQLYRNAQKQGLDIGLL